jgi:transposase InsO family protein
MIFRRFRVTTDSDHGLAMSPNHLGRQFTAARPNQLWMGDVTFLPTPEGGCDLAVLLDAYPRRVEGWAITPIAGARLPAQPIRGCSSATGSAAA